MDNTFDHNDSEKKSEDSMNFNIDEVDKTFVEGQDYDGQNPYKIRDLPTGDESIRLGSGVIKGVLGQGGMAKVYKIWNADFEMYRAVKLILPADNEQNY